VRELSRPPLEDAAELAGLLAAHALLSVAEGRFLAPLYGYESRVGERSMERLLLTPVEAAVRAGEQSLAANPHKGRNGVLIYDGRIHLPQGARDALVVQFRDFSRPEEDRVVIAIAYTPAGEGRPFAVHGPKALQAPQEGRAALFEAFFAGVARHTQAAAVWSGHRRSHGWRRPRGLEPSRNVRERSPYRGDARAVKRGVPRQSLNAALRARFAP
jgi:hypothetical protein